MQKLKERLALTAVTLTFIPPTILRLIATGNTTAIGLGATAAMLAGFVIVLAAVQFMGSKKW